MRLDTGWRSTDDVGMELFNIDGYEALDLCELWRRMEDELFALLYRQQAGKEFDPNLTFDDPELEKKHAGLLERVRVSDLVKAASWVRGTYARSRTLEGARDWTFADIKPRVSDGRCRISVLELLSYSDSVSLILGRLTSSFGVVEVEFPFDVVKSFATGVSFNAGPCKRLLTGDGGTVVVSFDCSREMDRGMRLSPKKVGARRVEMRQVGRIERAVISSFELGLPVVVSAELVVKGHGIERPGVKARVEVEATVLQVGCSTLGSMKLVLADGALWQEVSKVAGSKRKADQELVRWECLNQADVVEALCR